MSVLKNRGGKEISVLIVSAFVLAVGVFSAPVAEAAIAVDNIRTSACV